MEINRPARTRRIVEALVVSASVVAAHQIAQLLLIALAADGPVEVLPFFNIVEVWNRGVSFGMFNKLAHGQWILSALAIAITVALLRWLWLAKSRLHSLALGMIIGGAVGNTIDRLRHGAVADYLDFHAFGQHWPAFNVTDTAICIGVALLLWPTRKQNTQKRSTHTE